jgi:acetyl esterase/lipase
MSSIQIKYFVASLVLSIMSTSLAASTIIEDVAASAGGYDIPIKIMLPDNTNAKSPVFFFVHGGGWNGGTDLEVPNASIPNDANYLCDRLGIIYVGLAYRCKGNKGTFALAIEDLEASITWFMTKAEQYKADLTRIGFGGGSAGTSLSAILAQRYPSCKLYIGMEGMYNIVDQNPDMSFFPTDEGKKLFGLTSKEQKFEASAYYNLRVKPASALLFHGKDDFLCHFSQSKRYAQKINESGGTAKVVLYEHINHTCLNPGYPEVFRNSLMEIARFYKAEFQLKNIDFNAIESDLENRLQGLYPSSKVKTEQLIGIWFNKNNTLVLKEHGKGEFLNKKGNQIKSITYNNSGSTIYIIENNTDNPRTFYLRKNNNTIYESVEDDSRLKSRRIDYKKQKI